MATVPTYEQRVMPAPAPGMEATARLQGPLGYGAGLEAFGKDVQQGAEDVNKVLETIDRTSAQEALWEAHRQKTALEDAFYKLSGSEAVAAAPKFNQDMSAIQDDIEKGGTPLTGRARTMFRNAWTPILLNNADTVNAHVRGQAAKAAEIATDSLEKQAIVTYMAAGIHETEEVRSQLDAANSARAKGAGEPEEKALAIQQNWNKAVSGAVQVELGRARTADDFDAIENYIRGKPIDSAMAATLVQQTRERRAASDHIEVVKNYSEFGATLADANDSSGSRIAAIEPTLTRLDQLGKEDPDLWTPEKIASAKQGVYAAMRAAAAQRATEENQVVDSAAKAMLASGNWAAAMRVKAGVPEYLQFHLDRLEQEIAEKDQAFKAGMDPAGKTREAVNQEALEFDYFQAIRDKNYWSDNTDVDKSGRQALESDLRNSGASPGTVTYIMKLRDSHGNIGISNEMIRQNLAPLIKSGMEPKDVKQLEVEKMAHALAQTWPAGVDVNDQTLTEQLTHLRWKGIAIINGKRTEMTGAEAMARAEKGENVNFTPGGTMGSSAWTAADMVQTGKEMRQEQYKLMNQKRVAMDAEPDPTKKAALGAEFDKRIENLTPNPQVTRLVPKTTLAQNIQEALKTFGLPVSVSGPTMVEETVPDPAHPELVRNPYARYGTFMFARLYGGQVNPDGSFKTQEQVSQEANRARDAAREIFQKENAASLAADAKAATDLRTAAESAKFGNEAGVSALLRQADHASDNGKWASWMESYLNTIPGEKGKTMLEVMNSKIASATDPTLERKRIARNILRIGGLQ